MSYNRIIVERKLREFIEEDCQFNDVSSSFIPENEEASAIIKAKSNGFICGLKELKILYDMLDVKTTFLKNDGEEIHKGDIIVEVSGKARQILLGERIGLNLLMHMSAITTTTRKYVNLAQSSGRKVRIACTRKTTPGIRIFEKRAVEVGGGDTHRYSLDDMILLKDTHLRYYNGDVKALLEVVKETASFTKKIEIEVEKIEDVIIAAETGVDIIMLDNMTLEQVEETVKRLKELELRDKVLLEISGGITFENLAYCLDAEPDIISTSALIQFPSENVDLSLRFQ